MLALRPPSVPWPVYYKKLLSEITVDYTIFLGYTYSFGLGRLYGFRKYIYNYRVLKGNFGDRLRNNAGTGDLLFFPLFCLFITCLVCSFMKSGSQQTLIVKYQRSIIQSTANGSINIPTTILIFFVFLTFMIGSVVITVSMKSISCIFHFSFEIHKESNQLPVEQLEDADIGHGVPLGFFFTQSTLSLLVITCFMWNLEFKAFLLRKLFSTFSRMSAFRRGRVLPPLTENTPYESHQHQTARRSRRAWEPLEL